MLCMCKLLAFSVLLCIVLGDYILCINTRSGCHTCCKGFHVPYARNAVGSFVYYMSHQIYIYKLYNFVIKEPIMTVTVSGKNGI